VQVVLNMGMTGMRLALPQAELSRILPVFNHALSRVFLVWVPLLGISFVCAIFLRWENIKNPNVTEQVEADEEVAKEKPNDGGRA